MIASGISGLAGNNVSISASWVGPVSLEVSTSSHGMIRRLTSSNDTLERDHFANLMRA